MSELLPCPFCGLGPFYGQHRINGVAVYDIGCPSIDCLAQPECSEKDYETAKAAWNRRSPPAPAIDVEAVVQDVRSELARVQYVPGVLNDVERCLRAALGGKEQR